MAGSFIATLLRARVLQHLHDVRVAILRSHYQRCRVRAKDFCADVGASTDLMETFQVSTDLRFAEKLEASVGLYLNPPEHAFVLCCDEKSQIQALDRTQPGLPLKRGRAGTMTRDYKRNGTAT